MIFKSFQLCRDEGNCLGLTAMNWKGERQPKRSLSFWTETVHIFITLFMLIFLRSLYDIVFVGNFYTILFLYLYTI